MCMLTAKYPVIGSLLTVFSCYDCHLWLNGGKPNLSPGRVIWTIPKRTDYYDLSSCRWIDPYWVARTDLLLAEPQYKEEIWSGSVLRALIEFRILEWNWIEKCLHWGHHENSTRNLHTISNRSEKSELAYCQAKSDSSRIHMYWSEIDSYFHVGQPAFEVATPDVIEIVSNRAHH